MNGAELIDPLSARFSVHRPGSRGKPLARERPGMRLGLRRGNYDIEVNYRAAGGLETVWLEGFRVEGDVVETIPIGRQLSRLTVTLVDQGQPVAPAQRPLPRLPRRPAPGAPGGTSFRRSGLPRIRSLRRGRDLRA